MSGAPPRIGFVGVGWIGRHRMQAVIDAGDGRVAAIADSSADALADAARMAPSAEPCSSLEALLDVPLDGIVIATPSALHAEQARKALNRGVSVFCQKPLGRSCAETASVVDAARKADRLLSVDLSYRQTDALKKVRELVEGRALGRVYAATLTFHNGYGPDKAWFYDPELSGGGCVIDLGTHLVDAALWVLGFPAVERIDARLYSGGTPIVRRSATHVEDYAVARLDLSGGIAVDIACSWNLHVGKDCVISADFFGTEGSAGIRNVGGSFYDFVATRRTRTSETVIATPPDAWGGRAIVEWAQQLAKSPRYRRESDELPRVAAVLDELYGRGRARGTLSPTPALSAEGE